MGQALSRAPRVSVLRPALTLLLAVSIVLFTVLMAGAQTADSIGIRAQGMGGAFTAVADDATASWWNPGGLATGSYLSTIVEYGQLKDVDQDHRGFALGFPSLGVSYYRLTVSEIPSTTGSTGASGAGRQDQGTLVVRSLEVSQLGVTVGQSVGGHLVIGSTLKFVRAAGDSDAGLDIGALAQLGLVRLGLTVRNVTEPTFGEGPGAMTLHRQYRAGASVATVPKNSFALTVALDADIQPVMTATGEERRIAVGAELWTLKRVLGARGGYSSSTLGDRRAAPTAGLSVNLYKGVYADGQVTGGSDGTRRGWGAALRLTF